MKGSEIINDIYHVSGSEIAYTIPLYLSNGEFWIRMEVSKKLHDKYVEANQNK